MDNFLKICGAAVITIILSAILKNRGSHLSPYLGEITAILIISSAVTALVPLFNFLKGIITDGEITGDLYGTLIKASFIAVVSHVIYDLCKENGENMLASAVEFTGNAEIVLLSLPLISSLLNDTFKLLDI